MLFNNEPFTSHAGLPLDWKIECEALTDDDIATIADIVGKRFTFHEVVGIPRGGLRLQEALKPYARNRKHLPVLIVDDVLTTGKSMEEIRATLYPDAIGFVIFARGKCPEWITPLFQLSEGFQ